MSIFIHFLVSSVLSITGTLNAWQVLFFGVFVCLLVFLDGWLFLYRKPIFSMAIWPNQTADKSLVLNKKGQQVLF